MWPALYDVESLKECKVPCAAVVYYNDMYVDHVYQEETAALFQDFKIWITNEYCSNQFQNVATNNSNFAHQFLLFFKFELCVGRYSHSGLQDDGYHILGKLFSLVRNETHMG